MREFDNLTKRFYSIFDDGLNECTKSTEIYMDIRSEILREEMDIVLDRSYPVAGPNENAKLRKFKKNVKTLPVSDKTVEPRIEKVEQDSSEDVIVSDKNIKIVFQLPINNKKENIKVVTHDDNTVALTYLNYDGKRYTCTLDIPIDIEFESTKATFKNGILEVTFDRQKSL